MSSDYDIVAFKNAKAWRQWLSKRHTDTDGVWLRLYKKASGVPSVTYAQALDDALCFGWIDGQKKTFDELSYLQKFTPRRPRSMWSKRNIEFVARLSKAGLMMPAGISEVERAKQDGRWAAAYDKPSEMVIPEYFMVALHRRPKAEAAFNALNKSARYAVGWRLQTAKTEETRQRRQQKMLDMLERGQFA